MYIMRTRTKVLLTALSVLCIETGFTLLGFSWRATAGAIALVLAVIFTLVALVNWMET